MRATPSTASAPATPGVRAEPRSPLLILLNARSGSGDRETLLREVRSVLEAAGRSHQIVAVGRHESVEKACARLARQAAGAGGVLVAAGGDGTVNACVNAAREHGVPLGLLPMGTFNYFAREHGIPLDAREAAQVLATGVPRPVSMGEVNGRLFFNNAGFGLYTQLIRRRERAKRRFGRRQIVAALSAVGALIRGQRPFAIQTIADDTAALQSTSMVFVACNAFQLELLGLDAAACRRAGALAVVMLRPTHLGQRLRLLLRTALRQLDEDGRLDSFCAQEFEVRSARRQIEVVIDGEAVRLAPPLRFRAVPDVVELIVPAGAAAAPR